MLEMGQPNHAFDYDFLRKRADGYDPKGPVKLITRLPNEGETLTTLDGTVHKLLPHNILVTDPAGNLSLGGIMGGANSEIKPETKDVFLEAAAWNFINIRRTATDLLIHTEAGFRFSRGVHPSQAILGAKRAAELLRRLAGGTVAKGLVDYYPQPPEAVVVQLDFDYARRLSGLDLNGEEMGELLGRLDFKVTVADDHLVATVPDHRMDIEGPHDLVEEICRMYGYDNIPSTVLSDLLPPQRANVQLDQEERMKDILAKAGLQEIITFRLTSAADEGKLIPATHSAGLDPRPYITLTNPLSPERASMRHTVLASVLEIMADNSRYQERIAIFEIGPIFIQDEEEVLPTETMQLSMAMTGTRGRAGWLTAVPDKMDFFDLKGALETLFRELHVEVTYEAAEHPTYRPGRTAKILLNGQQIGVMGELHPLVADQFDIHLEKDQAVLAADINLEALIPHIPPYFQFDSISPYPAVREDLAIVVDQHVKSIEVEDIIRMIGGRLLISVELFDLYEGDQIGAGKKSLAYHLTFQAPDKTLNDKVVRKSREKILGQLKKRLGATLRE